ncbi:hypothetical protein SALBM217S_09313 [Streptomyces griseoloalbus]
MVWKPTNSVQKCTFSRRWSSIVPVIFGHQKLNPPNMANTIVPNST